MPQTALRRKMEKIVLPKITEEKISDLESRIVIEPLFPGYGHTLGNALRRVLLSSIPGASITSFRIEGAPHEFTSLPHVKEDLIEILMNLKSIKIKSHSWDTVKLTLNANNQGQIKAGDLSKNADIEILNPDQVIATLDKNAKFEMEVNIEKDRGFRSTDDINAIKEIGHILIDAAFTPVERVKIDVENTRVGQMTNYDKLIMHVSTNGSVTPHEAVVDASNVLIDHYKVFAFNTELVEPLTTDYQEPEEEFELLDNENGVAADSEVMINSSGIIDPKTKIEDTGLTPRTANALINAGIKTLAGLQRLSDLKLSEIKGLGKKGIEEIKAILEKNENA